MDIQTLINSSEAKGARFASVRLACPVKLLKKSRSNAAPCPFDAVTKHSASSVIINFDYAGNVNRQRERENVQGEFKAKDNYFEHVSPAIVAHKVTGERYVFLRFLASLAEPTFTLADGSPVARVELAAYLPADDLSDFERAVYGLDPKPVNEWQGIEGEIRPFTVKLANIRELTLDGATFAFPTTVSPERITKPSRKPAPMVSGDVTDLLHRSVLMYTRNSESRQ